MMKDEAFLTGVLSRETVSLIRDVVTAPDDAPFSELAKAARLEPSRDFRHSDLRGINLTGSDIRGWDLTGADLRDVYGVRVQWDESTIFTQADIGGSIFASPLRLKHVFDNYSEAKKLFDRISRKYWFDQALWVADHLGRPASPEEIHTSVAEALFHKAPDGALRSEILRWLKRRMEPQRQREMLLATIADHPDMPVITPMALNELRKLQAAWEAKKTATVLLDSRNLKIQEAAATLLLRTRPTTGDLAEIIRRVEAGNSHLGQIYVKEIATRLGDVYDLVTRDPISNERFAMNEIVSRSTRRLIARRWLRAERTQDPTDRNRILAERRGARIYIDQHDIDVREHDVERCFSRLRRYGINFSLAGEANQNQPSLEGFGPLWADSRDRASAEGV